MNSESIRCRSIRWLLRANHRTSKDDALNFIIYNMSINTCKLLQAYKIRIEDLLFSVIPDMDCVYEIIKYGNLLNPFYVHFSPIDL